MFSKVLIATDSSPSSMAVVRCAKSLRHLGTKEFVLAQCFQIREHVAFPHQIKSYIESTLNAQKEILEKEGIPTTIVVEAGFPGTGIPRIAAEKNCSLIVSGSHGHNFASEILMGGTSAEILHNATRPVLIVRLKLDEDTGQIICAGNSCDFMHHVLYPTDFSAYAEQSFHYVKKLVECGAHRVTIMHVQDKSRLGGHLKDRLEDFNKIDMERLEDIKERLKNISNAEIDMEIPYGSPTEEILKRIEKGDVTFTIMGSHGRGFISEMFLGSVSHNVARHSEVPVLLITGKPKISDN
jgi:nucleotide-binding universal stress UspA family protein